MKLKWRSWGIAALLSIGSITLVYGAGTMHPNSYCKAARTELPTCTITCSCTNRLCVASKYLAEWEADIDGTCEPRPESTCELFAPSNQTLMVRLGHWDCRNKQDTDRFNCVTVDDCTTVFVYIPNPGGGFYEEPRTVNDCITS